MTGEKQHPGGKGRKSAQKKAPPQASHPRRGAKAPQTAGKGVVAKKGSPRPKAKTVAIDRVALQQELQELAGKDVKVKLRIDAQGERAAGIRQTDNGFEIYLNPRRIRTEGKLEEHISWFRSQLA